MTVYRGQLIAAFALVTLAYVVGLLFIQQSRLEACRSNYEGVRQVFVPFLPSPTVATAKQARDIEKFNARIEELKQGCHTQVYSKLWP